MSLDSIINLTINLREPPITLAGFGTPLVAAILTAGQDAAWDTAYGASVDTIEVTEANWQTTMTTLGVSSAEDLYVGLSDLFGQDRAPSLALIGRRSTAVAQVLDVDIDATTDGTFTVTLNGTDYAFAASGNTATEIRDGLLAAIALDTDSDNDGVADIAGAIVDTDTLSVTAAVAGVPFTYSVSHSSNPSAISATLQTASNGLVDDVGTWRAERDDWYFLLETTRASGVIRAVGETIETMRKLFVAQTDDAALQTTSVENIGTALGPVGLNLNRTSLWWSDNDDQFVDFAIVGKMAPSDPGSETWNAQSLRSVVGITPTSETQLQAKRTNWLEAFTAANFAMTQGGYVSSGQWLDLIRGRDWLYNKLQIALVQALRDNPKLPYTDEGGEAIGAVIQGVLEDAAEVGLVVASSIVVVVPPAASQSDTDRGNRHFPDVTFRATLQGAIHTMDVTGDLAP